MREGRRDDHQGVGDETPGDGSGNVWEEKEWNGTVRDGWNFRECEKGELEFLGMDGTFGREKGLNGTVRDGGTFGREKGGTVLLGMDGTFGREKGWNGTFRDGWNFWEGRGVERNF